MTTTCECGHERSVHTAIGCAICFNGPLPKHCLGFTAPAADSRDTEGREAYLAERYGNGAYAFALSVLGLLETNESTMSVYEHALLVLKSRAASVPEGTNE